MSDESVFFNIKSPKQVAKFLFEYLELEPIKTTAKGAKSTDESVINYYAEKEEIEFCKLLMHNRKLEKAISTYIIDLNRWIQSALRYGISTSLVHPDLWLNTTETVRSSSSNPNWQNQPKHGDIIPGIPWEMLRKPITTLSPDFLLGEVDFEVAEVKTVANLSEDKQLIMDCNTGLDMHSHWTNVIFGWNKSFDDIKANHKDERHIVKNNWTFANIYLASNKSIAEAFRKFDVYKDFVYHKWGKLKSKQDFFSFFETYSEDHIADCQQEFFNRYRGLSSWQKNLVGFYYANGYVETPLGFRRNHPLTKNEIVNFPVQSVSFHILLDSILRIQKKLLKHKFKSLMICQIHDSILWLLYKKEIYDLMEMVDEEMCNHNLPVCTKAKLGTEWSVGHNWLEMKTIPNFN